MAWKFPLSREPNGPPADDEGARRERARLQRVYARYEAQSLSEAWDINVPGNLEIRDERRERLREWLTGLGRMPSSMLELGCGTGRTIQDWLAVGLDTSSIVGADLLPDRLQVASRDLPSSVRLVVCDGYRLPFPDASFEVISCFTVLSSIANDRVLHSVASELGRVVKPEGAIVCYDMRYGNPRNPEVRPITVRHLRKLFPAWHIESRSLTVLPPLARKLGRTSRFSYPLCRLIPVLRSHQICFITGDAGKRDA